MNQAVVEIPQFGALVPRVPLPMRIAKRKDPLFRPRAFFLAARAAEHRVMLARLQGLQQTVGFQQSATRDGTEVRRIGVGSNGCLIAMDPQLHAELRTYAIAKRVHLRELEGGIDMQ